MRSEVEESFARGGKGLLLLLMVSILHYLKSPRLWQLWSMFLVMGIAGLIPSP